MSKQKPAPEAAPKADEAQAPTTDVISNNTLEIVDNTDAPAVTETPAVETEKDLGKGMVQVDYA